MIIKSCLIEFDRSYSVMETRNNCDGL